MKKAPKRRPGRPPKEGEPMVQLAIRFPKRMIEAIDEIVAGRLDQPERSAIIRELLAEALEGAKATAMKIPKPPSRQS